MTIRPRFFDVRGRRLYLGSPSRRTPGTHPLLAAHRLYTYRFVLVPHAGQLLSTLPFSQNMAVTPIEVEPTSPPTGTAKPKPAYGDNNITVYPIPLFPEVDNDGDQCWTTIGRNPFPEATAIKSRWLYPFIHMSVGGRPFRAVVARPIGFLDDKACRT